MTPRFLNLHEMHEGKLIVVHVAIDHISAIALLPDGRPTLSVGLDAMRPTESYEEIIEALMAAGATLHLIGNTPGPMPDTETGGDG